MSEHNKIKARPCPRCGKLITGKASALKRHAQEHLPIEREAAAEALMEKMKQDMLANENIQMADERVLNAEGD